MLLIAACWMAGCERSQPSAAQAPAGPTSSSGSKTPATIPSLRTVDMTIGSRPFTLEVAETPGAQELGLMNRPAMAPDRGMIFVFPDESPRTFWMKDTLIPLDILYVSRAGVVVNVSQMKALDETGVPSRDPAKYAIELNVGAAADVGVKVGDRVNIPAACREPRK